MSVSVTIYLSLFLLLSLYFSLILTLIVLLSLSYSVSVRLLLSLYVSYTGNFNFCLSVSVPAYLSVCLSAVIDGCIRYKVTLRTWNWNLRAVSV
jgi:hypothetical protein